MKRLHAIVALFLCLCFVAPAVADTLVLPKGMKAIEDEAFAGDTSLDEVIVPEGTVWIDGRSFADSGLKRISLPSTLRYLANDAFENTSLKQINAEWNTVGANWALENGVELVSSTDSSFSPVGTVKSAGYTIAENGMDVTDYLGKCFNVQDVVGGWFKITAPVGGSYTFSVKASNISETFYLCVYANRNDKISQIAKFRFDKSDEIVTYKLDDVIEGETIYWWDAKSSNMGHTFLDPFQLMVAPVATIATVSTHTGNGDVMITKHPESLVMRIDSTAIFEVKAENAKTYKWQVSTDNRHTWIDLTDSSSVIEVAANAENNGNWYRCIVYGTKENDSCISEQACLTVKKAPATQIWSSNEDVILPFSGGFYPVAIDADGSWEILNKPNWVKLEVFDNRIVIKTEVNDSSSSREGEIVLAAENYIVLLTGRMLLKASTPSVQKTIKIIQEPTQDNYGSFRTAPTHVKLRGSAGAYQRFLNIYAPGSWVVKSCPSWLYLRSGSSTGSFVTGGTGDNTNVIHMVMKTDNNSDSVWSGEIVIQFGNETRSVVVAAAPKEASDVPKMGQISGWKQEPQIGEAIHFSKVESNNADTVIMMIDNTYNAHEYTVSNNLCSNVTYEGFATAGNHWISFVPVKNGTKGRPVEIQINVQGSASEPVQETMETTLEEFVGHITYYDQNEYIYNTLNSVDGLAIFRINTNETDKKYQLVIYGMQEAPNLEIPWQREGKALYDNPLTIEEYKNWEQENNGIPISLRDLRENPYLKIAIGVYNSDSDAPDYWTSVSLRIEDGLLEKQEIEAAANRQAIVEEADKWLTTTFPAAGMPKYTKASVAETVPTTETRRFHGMPYVGNDYCRSKNLTEYDTLTQEERLEVLNNYPYSNYGMRSSAKWGTECVGFLKMCWYYALRSNEYEFWKEWLIEADTTLKNIYSRYEYNDDYSFVLPGDAIVKGGHVMLAISNNTETDEIIVIEQTAEYTDGCKCQSCSDGNTMSLGTRKMMYTYSTLKSKGYHQITRLKECMPPTEDLNNWRAFRIQ